MKSLLTLSAILLLSTQVKAETFECIFTEPFVSINYSTKTEKLGILDAVSEKLEVKENVELKFSATGALTLKAGDEVLATITQEEGSDGMSDYVYPFSIEYAGMIGACESTEMKKFEREELEIE